MKIAVLADIHANSEALKAVLAEIKKQGINKIVNCGDLVGYNCSPNEVIEIIKKEKILSIAGNHDVHAVDLKEFDFFNEFAQAALLWTNRILTAENKKYLLSLDDIGEGNLDGRKIILIHGSPENRLWDYVMPNVFDEILRGYLEKTKADILIFGHTHLPFVRRIDGKLVINPGSVGQSRNFIPEAFYCVLDLENLSASIEHISYDINKEASKIITAGLPRHLADRLFSGQ